MSKLPVVSGRDALRVLIKNGFYIRDQKGSHVHLRHPARNPLTIPMHSTIAKGTLLQILKDSEKTREEFLRLL